MRATNVGSEDQLRPSATRLQSSRYRRVIVRATDAGYEDKARPRLVPRDVRLSSTRLSSLRYRLESGHRLCDGRRFRGRVVCLLRHVRARSLRAADSCRQPADVIVGSEVLSDATESLLLLPCRPAAVGELYHVCCCCAAFSSFSPFLSFSVCP